MNIRAALKAICAFITVIVLAGQVLAMDYFDEPINFWKEQSVGKPATAPKSESTPKAEQVETKKSDFDWKTYLDPKHDEFFREGDYTPPKPFMEVARNPSDENLKNWFEYMRMKNELATRLQTRMQEYAGQPAPLPQAPMIAKRASAPASLKVDPKRFRFRMYFDSHCPHCKRMFETLERLEADGFDVEALQVDSGPLLKRSGTVQIERATPGDVKKHNIESIPHVIVADLKREALLPAIKGYQSYEDVIQLLREVN